MGRSPCCSKVGMRRGPWSTNEDNLLTNYIQQHGEGQWRSLPKEAGLLRCGKSCRLRWMNYLRPGIKRGNITEDEEDLILRLHRLLGNRWSLIAGRLPGRTDNDIKNHWNTHLLKKVNNSGLHHRKPTKTKKTTAVKKNIRENYTIDEEQKDNPPKMKVYVPKPIRVSPLFSTGEAAEKVLPYMPAALSSPLFGVGGEEDGFLGGGYIFHRWDSVSSTDINMLDQVYDEYLQLLLIDP